MMVRISGPVPHGNRVIAVVLACALLLGVAGPVAAQCPETMAANSYLEDGFSTRGAGEVEVANGWQPWYQDGPRVEEGYFKRPEWKPENAALFGSRRVHGGNFAQKWFTTYGTHNAGIFQQVNVPAGATVMASAWFQTWTNNEDDITVSSGNYRTYIGIDPTGGTNALAGTVIWSSANMVTDQWVQQSVQAQAQGGTITVFLRGEPEFRNKHNDAYVDDICVRVVQPPAPTARPTNTPGPTYTPGPTDAPEPTATPEPTETPAPTDAPAATATPTSGPQSRIVVYTFEDLDEDGSPTPGEGPLAGVLVELLDEDGVEMASFRTGEEPRAFEDLQPGSYTVVVTDLEGYRGTGPQEIPVTLVARAVRELNIGQAPLPAATETPAPTSVPPTATSVAAGPEDDQTAVDQPEATPVVPAIPATSGAAQGGFFQRFGGLLLAAAGLAIGVPVAVRLYGKHE